MNNRISRELIDKIKERILSDEKNIPEVIIEDDSDKEKDINNDTSKNWKN